ncbi:MAG: hypothetical protein GWN16_04075 [Calditrichae bacterium]|nr:hypothetical protein [Calditrichia bacterium]
MKVLKIFGIIVLIVVALIVIFGLIAPNKYDVERTVMIDAPKELVFEHVKYWRNWTDWSPWAENDPTMQASLRGEDGKQGSKYVWTGDPDKTGKGEMTNTGIKEYEEISYHLHFIEPWESESDGYVRVADAQGGTRVAWGFQGETPFPWNIFMLFMSMEDMVAKDFDRGLKLLKNICEEEASAVLSYEVKTHDFPQKHYAVIRDEVPIPHIADFFTASFATIGKTLQMKHMKVTGPPCGLYYSWNEQQMKTEMAAALPVRGKVNTDQVKTVTLPASKAYSVNYYGPYEQSMFAHKALDLYIARNGMTMKSPVIEEYITDPGQEPDSTKWLTKIYYFAE